MAQLALFCAVPATFLCLVPGLAVVAPGNRLVEAKVPLPAGVDPAAVAVQLLAVPCVIEIPQVVAEPPLLALVVGNEIEPAVGALACFPVAHGAIGPPRIWVCGTTPAEPPTLIIRAEPARPLPCGTEAGLYTFRAEPCLESHTACKKNNRRNANII